MEPSTGRQEILGEIARQRGVALVYLFGSQAQAGARYLRGEEAVAESGSGLDVGVVFSQRPSGMVISKLNLEKPLASLPRRPTTSTLWGRHWGRCF